MLFRVTYENGRPPDVVRTKLVDSISVERSGLTMDKARLEAGSRTVWSAVQRGAKQSGEALPWASFDAWLEQVEDFEALDGEQDPTRPTATATGSAP